jgi:predicted hydrocarbon binding protein
MPDFSPRFLRAFVETISSELGEDGLRLVLGKAGLSLLFSDPTAVARFDASAAADAYAEIQQALRTYYGRGARGILQRVGSQFWKRLIEEAPLTVKPQIPLARTLATAAHPKPVLDLLARLLSTAQGDLTVHTLDLDLLLVDHASPSTINQHGEEPICWVTLGLARAALLWATGREYDVSETSCRATGEQACKFQIKIGAAK